MTTEAEIHAGIVDWLKVALPTGSLFHHSPNAGKHHIRYRMTQLRLGMQPGWPDLEIFCHPDGWVDPAGAWRPVFLEIKTKRGKPSDNQVQMIERLRAVGCYAEIVRSIDETQAALQQWMELRLG